MSRVFAVLIVLSLCLTPSLSSAFDGNRKGFILGIGLGGHVVDVDIEPDNHAGVASSFRLGLGVTERVLLYYQNNVSWYNRDGHTVTFGLSGFGASFFFGRSAPAFYLTGAVGLSSYNSIDDDTSFFGNNNFVDEGDGTGYMFGAGLELRRHLTLEAVVYQTEIDPDRFANDFDAATLQFLVNMLFY